LIASYLLFSIGYLLIVMFVVVSYDLLVIYW